MWYLLETCYSWRLIFNHALRYNEGYVVVGTSADTSEFAVDAICWWWEGGERPTFPDESKLLILSDAGGSDGCRFRLWKKQLQEQLADRLGIEVMVCHYPTGASKWTPLSIACSATSL